MDVDNYLRQMTERAESAEDKLHAAMQRYLRQRDELADAQLLIDGLRELASARSAAMSMAADLLREGKADEALTLLDDVLKMGCAP